MPSTTQGRWQQSTPFGDGQIFVGATDFKPTAASGAVTLVSAGAGLLTLNQAASLTGNLIADISKLLRTGELAIAGVVQEQFGTAASQPGPSSVAHTSGPFNLPGNPGFPPWLKSKMPTVSGNASTKDPIPKGLQVK